MQYPEALAKLYSLSSEGIKMGLERVRVAAQLIDNPQNSFRAVQIAGTNGKGSVASLLAHGVAASGYRVGLFTSPHLHRFSERIRLDGQEVATEVLARHLERIFQILESSGGIRLTFFEVATLAALSIFEESRVDLAVLEVGLGGRLDATSIVPVLATAITSIGFDHMEFLGHTLAEIAREKAGIAHPRVPLVTGILPPEALREVERHATRVGAPLLVLERDFPLCRDIPLPLPGRHFQQNGSVALKLFEALRSEFPSLDPGTFREAARSWSWPGRLEKISLDKEYLLDGAHNLEAVESLVEVLVSSGQVPMDVVLFGSLKGKQNRKMLQKLRPIVREVILAPPPLSRACDPSDYADEGDVIVRSIEAGIKLIQEERVWAENVLITGSLFTVAEGRRLLLGETADPPIGL